MAKKCPYCGSILDKYLDNEWICPDCGEVFYSDSSDSEVYEEDAIYDYFDEDDEEEDEW